MPTKKTTKKPATKRVAKKAPVKKAIKPTVVAKPVFTDIPEPDRYCHCTKRKRNMILTCVSITAFCLGFLTYHLFFCDGHHFKPKPQLTFVNGCLDASSIKCPIFLNDLPSIDTDHDGCVTKVEMRAAKKAMRHHKKHAPVEEPAVVDAIAPVME